MDEKDITDEEFIAEIVKAREESVAFFDSEKRAERELWVVNEFLTNLNLPYASTEMVHVKDDPPDVCFRDAQFEIKEILDMDRRRHAEYKALLAKARAATSPRDLLEHYEPRDMTYTEICVVIDDRVTALAKKYGKSSRKQLDLLFYVNFDDVHGYIQRPLPPPEQFASSGFRSVSFVCGRIAGVLMANSSAPDFLHSGGVPKVVRKSDGDQKTI